MLLATVFGARPQFIKAAPLSKALSKANIDEVMINTGQHFDYAMSDIFFRELGLRKPDHNLDIQGRGHGDMTGRMLSALEPLLLSVCPDAVLVYGDTNSTLAGALAGAKAQIPIVHVEAGLRSYNRRMPEELNRIVTDHLSTLLLCPTQTAVANLKREGITTHVYHVGDVMYDLASAVQPIAERSSTILEQLNLARRHYAVATVHRAETTDDESTLAEVVRYLQAVAADLPVIVPLHPRTRKALASARIALDGLRVIGPLGYLDMSQLARNSSLIITDSGGLQKEAYFYRVPCITLRKETEWTETIGCGWNRLWMEQDYKPRTEIVEYGDGTASETIAQAVVNTFG